MEASVGDILIVGAGIAGLTTSLGLHRLGIRSLVLESSDTLRETGFAFTTWNNAWKALDVLGIGDSLRQPHQQLQGMVVTSTISRQPPSERSLKSEGKLSEREIRCVRRKLLLEALVRELPIGTIRFSSKVVSVEESGYFKLVHLADGSILKTKDEFRRIEMGLNKFAKERRWRSFQLISTAYVVGFIHESKGKIMTFLRDKILPAFLTGVLIKRADFDCGELSILNATASV
ncbi:hypothetical protein Pint_34332 [Pistacia integerrima]|uniref:Uncharacterized protein n=1 Tax=Pistacia integerrima TaxID=434235 RepID=A0ACC0X508_9ROSI|nr:hypothetical protein Pint_34332 [Pistacia integerrima]